MIITAMFLYGISQHAWGFGWWYGLLTFIMDIIIAYLISPNARVINNTKISDEEISYWKKRTEVEELNRIKLDREVWGKRQ